MCTIELINNVLCDALVHFPNFPHVYKPWQTRSWWRSSCSVGRGPHTREEINVIKGPKGLKEKPTICPKVPADEGRGRARRAAVCWV